MICPRCSVGEISDRTHECTLCGFAPSGVATLSAPFPTELEASARRDLEHQFQIEGVLGQGPRGVVYLALEREQDRLVALKILPRTAATAPETDSLLQREAALAGSLDHPHIVPVYRAGSTRIFLWYAMEYCNSRSFGEALAGGDTAPMEWNRCLRVIHQVASGLDYAHRRGMTHGGVKPTNILLDARGWARVSDFGIARAFGRAVAVLGPDAPAEQRYLAPEQFASRNLAGPSVDQYALAVMTHDCLAGAPPAPHVLEALQRATSEHPSERYATILDFVTALEADTPAALPASTTDVTAAPTPGLPRRSSAVSAPLIVMDTDAPAAQRRGSLGAPRRRRIGGMIGVAAALIISAATAAWWILSPSPTATQTVTTLEPAPAPPAAPLTTGPATPSATSPARPSPVRSTPVDSGARHVTVPAATPPRQAPAQVVPRPRRAPPRPVVDAHLLLNTTPWSEILVDGVAVGNTPKSDLVVAPGPHHLRFQRDGFKPFETDVTVAPGASFRLTDIVLEPVTR